MKTFHPITFLDGQEVTRWVGTEMALSADEPEGGGLENVIWECDAVPFLQLTSLDLTLKDGATLRLLSQIDDGTGFFGLYLLSGFGQPPVGNNFPEPSLFRTRVLTNLPTGIVRVLSSRKDGPNATLEVLVGIKNDVIRFLSAEVYERRNGELEIVEADESILVPLNGGRPTD